MVRLCMKYFRMVGAFLYFRQPLSAYLIPGWLSFHHFITASLWARSEAAKCSNTVWTVPNDNSHLFVDTVEVFLSSYSWIFLHRSITHKSYFALASLPRRCCTVWNNLLYSSTFVHNFSYTVVWLRLFKNHYPLFYCTNLSLANSIVCSRAGFLLRFSHTPSEAVV